MSTEQIEASITDKVSRWKNAFKEAVERTASCVLADAETLSYVDILKSGGAHVTAGWLDQTIIRTSKTTPVFQREELRLLHSPGYWDVVIQVQDIFNGYDRLNFELQANQDGPVIISSEYPGIMTRHLGFIFHALPNLRLLETFYETENSVLTRLPDTFVHEGGDFYTVKAVKDLRAHPVLGPRMRTLGL